MAGGRDARRRGRGAQNLLRKVKRMESSVEEFRQRDETLRDTLMSTQKMVDDIKGRRPARAQLILDEARCKAEGMVQQGHNRLAQLYEDIENLKRQRSQFEIQLRGLLKRTCASWIQTRRSRAWSRWNRS